MTRVVALLTDFGPGSLYVGQMHAVLRRRLPGTAILDLAHDAPPGDVEAAAYLLRVTRPFLPPGCVTVVVVDPGVGTDRAILVGRVRDDLFIGPDNGVLANVLIGGVVRRAQDEALFSGSVSATFHGRDVMAPVAAYLADGGRFEDVGPVVDVREPPAGAAKRAGRIEGRILIEDRFGNLISNVPADWLADAKGLRVTIGAERIEGLHRTYGDVDTGSFLAYIGSGGHLEIAVHGGRASEGLGLGAGSRLVVETRGADA